MCCSISLTSKRVVSRRHVWVDAIDCTRLWSEAALDAHGRSRSGGRSRVAAQHGHTTAKLGTSKRDHVLSAKFVSKRKT